MPPIDRRIKSQYPFKYVRNNNGIIEYRPYIKVKDRRAEIKMDGKFFLTPPIKLGKNGDDPTQIAINLAAAKEQLKAEEISVKGQIGWIVESYMKSRQWKSKAASSQKRDRNLMKIIDHPMMINSKRSTFSKWHLKDLDKPFMNQIANRRLEIYQEAGKKGTVQVNREVTFISSAISWALNEIHGLGIHINPLHGRKKFTEETNKRYVTDEEYATQYKIAGEIRDWLQPILEIAYLGAARGVEVLDIRLSHINDEGIEFHRRKGSKNTHIQWSERLKKAYNQSLELHKKHKIQVIDPYLVTGHTGGIMPKSTLDQAMQDLKTKMTEKGMKDIYWNLHLAKSKGISDAENDKLAGHKSEAMRQLYNTKVQSFKPAK